MSLYQETKFIMDKYHIQANKNLGQNFLIDETVVEDIIQKASITKEDFVIEIGPGLGTLTSYLLEKASKVLCVELDEKMVTILKERFALYTNFEVIQEDVLKVDLKEQIKKAFKEEAIQHVKIVANLPYYITTPIVMKLLEERLPIDSITVMIQKEVAQRLTAIPGEKNTGAITYAVYYFSEAEEVRTVSKYSFIPEPAVESEVIHLKIRKNAPVTVKNEEEFFKLIKFAFMQRRKTLVNAITNSGMMTKQTITEILESIGLDVRVRGEVLTIEQFAQIANSL